VPFKPVTTIQNILFPVDFSPFCIAMAAYVRRAAVIRVILAGLATWFRRDCHEKGCNA
jgi:hypothetical protein